MEQLRKWFTTRQYRALAFGGTAFILQAIGDSLWERGPALSLLPLLLAAGAFTSIDWFLVMGTWGILSSIFLGVLSDDGIRIFVLSAVLHVSSVFMPRAPMYIVAFVLWSLWLGPLFLAGSSLGWIAPAWNLEAVITVGIYDLVFAILVGAILLNSTVWSSLASRPRHVPLAVLLAHIIGLIATLTLAAAVAGLHGTLPQWTASLNNPLAFAWLLALASIVIIVPLLVSERIAQIITSRMGEFAPLTVSGRTRTFGLPSSPAAAAPVRQESQTLSESAVTSRIGSDNDVERPVQYRIEGAETKGICALNRNGTISFINRRFRRMLGITDEDILGRNLGQLPFDGELRQGMLDLVERTFTKGTRKVELRGASLGERTRFFEVESRLPANFEGSSLAAGPDSIILLLTDLTDRRVIERHLFEAQKLSALGSIVKDIAHEFNNSLTSIAGQACVAQQSDDKSDVRRSLDEIIRATQRAGKVARQLLEFAEGAPGLEKPIDIADAVRERLPFFSRVLGDACELTFGAPSSSLAIKGDQTLVLQALTNLLQNAREAYGDKPGHVWLTIDTEEIAPEMSDLIPGARTGEFVRIRVRDEGIGMAPDILARVFDPLYTTKRVQGHAGLGLSIVYSIVRAHNGFLSAESAIEKGTTISLYFPKSSDTVVNERGTPETAQNRDDTELRGQQERILVVEDEPTVRDLVATMLSSLGYQVTTCSNGTEAIEHSGRENFDLILVDMILPRMRGIDIINELRSKKTDLRALVMTGYGNAADITPDKASVIYKPFDLDTLARSVRTSLTSSSARV